MRSFLAYASSLFDDAQSGSDDCSDSTTSGRPAIQLRCGLLRPRMGRSAGRPLCSAPFAGAHSAEHSGQQLITTTNKIQGWVRSPRRGTHQLRTLAPGPMGSRLRRTDPTNWLLVAYVRLCLTDRGRRQAQPDLRDLLAASISIPMTIHAMPVGSGTALRVANEEPLPGTRAGRRSWPATGCIGRV